MSTSISEIPNEAKGNPFISLRYLLNLGDILDALLDEDENNPYICLKKLVNHENVSVATLATAIESFGIYTWDKYGRFKLFQKDTPEAQQALLLLQHIFEYENDPTPGNSDKQHPLDVSNDWDDPYWRFGWAVNELPNLKTIKDGQLEVPQTNKSHNRRAESCNLKIIAALLNCINGDFPNVARHPKFTSEAQLIVFLETTYKEKGGFSISSLSHKFPEAKSILNGE